MRITKIRNDDEYRSALDEIERLMVASPTVGSAEADQLDVLSLLVEEYENSQFPIDLPSPIDAIRFRMDQMGLQPRDLIPFIGSSSRVSEVLNGKRSLTLTMMRALHRGLGIPAAVLLKEEEVEVHASTDLEWARFPIREMSRLGWLEPLSRKRITPGAAQAIMERFSAPLGGLDPAAVSLYRRTRTRRSARAMDPYALHAWCTRVRIKAQEAALPARYAEASLTLGKLQEIAQLSARSDGPLLAADAIRDLGIHFVIERHLSKTHLDGAALYSADGEPIIALTLRHDRLDSFWFCLLHECVHVARHLDRDSATWLDDMEANAHGSDKETEADEVAIEALVPSKAFRRSRAYSVRSPATVVALANDLGVHPAVVAGRVRYEAGNYRILNQLVGQGEVRRLFPSVFEGGVS